MNMLFHREGLRYHLTEINNVLGRISQSSLANDINFRKRFIENLPISGFSHELQLFVELQKHLRNIESHLKLGENVFSRMAVAVKEALDESKAESIIKMVREMEQKYLNLIEKVEEIKGLFQLVEKTNREERVRLLFLNEMDLDGFRFTPVYEQLWGALWHFKESLEELREKSVILARVLISYKDKLTEKLDYLKTAEDKISDFERNIVSWVK